MLLDLHPGERFWINGPWAYSHRVFTTDDLIFLRDDGTPWQMSEREFMERLAEGSAKFDPKYKDGRYPKTENMLKDLAFFSKKHLAIALDRLVFVEAIEAHGFPTPIEKAWPAIIASVTLPKSMQKRPSWYTVNRWVKRWSLSGRDLRSLIPNFRKRGRTKFVRTEEEQIFLAGLLNDYLRRPGPSKTDVWKKVDAAYDKAQRTRAIATTWHKPTRSAVFRMIDNLDPVKVVLEREGAATARKKFTIVGPGARPTSRLERVEFDHTDLNIMVVDDKGRHLGRPYITIAICCATRMVVGHYIGFEPPSDYSVAQCIRDMLMPKTYLKTVYGIEEITWDAFGRAVLAYVDNAGEFRSISFRDSQALLKTDIGYQPILEPWLKGRIERFMGTLSRSRVMRLPGGTGASVAEKGDYDPESDAVVSLFDLRKVFLRWMLTDYCNQIHMAILNTPADEWRKAVEQMPLQITDRDEVDAQLGFLTDAKLTTKGLRFHYLFYVSSELEDMLQRYHPDKRPMVKFRLNMDNLGSITVIDPDDGSTHTARCTWEDYASTVSKWQHEEIIKRQLAAAKEIVSQEQLINARIVLMEELEALLAKRKTRKKKSLARLRGGQYTNQRARVESEMPISQPTAETPGGLRAAEPNSAPTNQTEKSPAAPWADDDEAVPEFNATVQQQEGPQP